MIARWRSVEIPAIRLGVLEPFERRVLGLVEQVLGFLLLGSVR